MRVDGSIIGQPEEAADSNGNASHQTFLASLTGDFWWTARAIVNGVEGPDQQGIHFHINDDTTAPTVTLTSGHSIPASYSTPQHITWHINDSAGSGLAGWGAAWDSDPGSNQFTASDGYLDLPPGLHTLYVHTRDYSGNHQDWPFGPYGYKAPGAYTNGTIDSRIEACANGYTVDNVGRPIDGDGGWVHLAVGIHGSGVAQDYTGGFAGNNIIMAKDGASTAYNVRAAFWTRYSAMDFANSVLGFPTSNEIQLSAPASPPSPHGTAGWVTHFEDGDLYNGENIGAFYVIGSIRTQYDAAGASSGRFGFPTGDPYDGPNGKQQNFEGGTLYEISDSTKPRVSLTAPATKALYATAAISGATARGATLDEAGGSGVARVEGLLYRYNANGSGGVYFDGSGFGSAAENYRAATLAGGSWTYQLPTTAQGFIAGRYAMKARVTDNAGNVGYSLVVGFTVKDDIVAPQVVIDNPVGGKSYAASVASGGLAKGRAQDNAGGSGVASVTVVILRYGGSGVTQGYWNGTNFSSATEAPRAATVTGAGALKNWSFRLPTTAQGFVPGRYAMKAVARDAADNVRASRVITFTLTP